MPIPSEDQSKLRSGHHIITDVRWDIWPRVTVATASVNQTTFSYPLGELTVDNTSAGWLTDVEVGMYYEIHETTGERVTVGVIRKPVTTNRIYIDAKSPGDPGTTQRLARALANDQVITVYSFRPLWGLISRINNRRFFKKFDIAYTNQGSNGSPVVNFGEWQHILVPTPTNRATLTFNADPNGVQENSSYAHFGKTITGVLWDLPAAVTLLEGALTDNEITVSVPVGFHEIGCTLTQNTGDSRRGIRPVWVKSRTGEAEYRPFSDSYRVTIDSDRQNLKGREITITITYGAHQTVPDIMEGAAFILRESATYNGEKLSDGILTDTFVGFVQSWSEGGDANKRWITCNLKSPFSILSEVPTVSQQINEKPNPSNWTHILRGYGEPNLLMWYILEHHCANLFTLFDYYRLLPTPPRKKNMVLNGSSIQQQLEEVAALLLGSNIGSESSGALHFKVDPNEQDAAFRSAMDQRMTLLDQDVTRSLERDIVYRPPVGQLILYAFAQENNKTVALASIAPGNAQGQGIGRPSGQSVITIDQSRLNEEAGHYLAKLNSPIPSFNASMNRNFDVFDPARQYNAWWGYNFSARFSPFNRPFVGRSLVTEVNRTWNEGAGTKKLNNTFQPETFGQPGTTMPVRTGGAGSGSADGGGSSGGGGGGPTGGTTIPPPEQGTTRRFAVAWDDQGNMGRTFNIYAGTNTAWEDIKGDISGTVTDLDFDWYSSYPASGFLNGRLGAWCCSITGTSFYVYYTEDLMADSVVWEEQAQFFMNDSSADTAGHLIASRTIEGLVVAAWHDRKGCVVITTTNGGGFWNSRNVGPRTVTDTTDNDGLDFAFELDGQRTVCTGIDSDGDWKLWRNSTPGGSFSLITDTPTSEKPFTTAHINSAGTLYTAVDNLGTEASGETYNSSNLGPNPANYSPPPTVAGYDDSCYGASTSPAFYSGSWRFLGTGGRGICLEITFPDNEVVNLASWSLLGSSVFQQAGGANIFGRVQHTLTLYDVFGDVIDTYSYLEFGADPGGFAFSSAVVTFSNVPGVNKLLFQTKVPARDDDYYGGVTTDVWYSTFGFNTLDRKSYNSVFYRVASYTGAAVWTDISPELDSGIKMIPLYQYGMSIDPVNAGDFSGFFAPSAGSSQRLYRSANGGNSYNLLTLPTASNTDTYRGLVRSGNVALLFGPSKLQLSINYGQLPVDVRGDWADAVGDIGTFLGCKGIL